MAGYTRRGEMPRSFDDTVVLAYHSYQRMPDDSAAQGKAGKVPGSHRGCESVQSFDFAG